MPSMGKALGSSPSTVQISVGACAIIPALRRKGQEDDSKVKVNLFYIVNSAWTSVLLKISSK